MKSIKTLLLAAIVLTAISGIAFADTASAGAASTANTLANFSKNKISRDAVKAELGNRYAAGTLTKADLKTLITAAYRHNQLKREDLGWLLGQMYREGKLTRTDLRWVLTEAYKNNELTRDDLRYIIGAGYEAGQLKKEDLGFLVTAAYKAGELKRGDVAWIITHAYKADELTMSDMKDIIAAAYKAGELSKDDLRDIVIASYNAGELTRDDVRRLLVQMYIPGELTRSDLRSLITAAYNHGELTRADIKWLLMQAYKAGELNKDDVKQILAEAYKAGELRKSDVDWILSEGYKAGEISQSDISIAEVTGTAVQTASAPVPSMPEVTSTVVAASAEAAETAPAAASGAVSTKDELKTTQAWMLYKYALVPAEKHRIGMDALIGYVESISGDTAKLTELKNQFVTQEDSLKAAAEKADYLGGKVIVGQMWQTVASFKTEVTARVGNNTVAARAALNTALQNNEDYLDSLVTEAREARRDRNLEAFDFANAKIQARLDQAKAKGADVSALQAKLDEIKDSRSQLIDAMNAGVDSCKGEGIGKCTTPEASAYVTLRNEIATKYKELRELAKNVGQSQKVSAAITKARATIAAGEQTLSTAEGRGIDVSVEKAKLTAIKALVDSADAKYAGGDLTGAMDDLKKAQESFISLKSEVSARRGTK